VLRIDRKRTRDIAARKLGLPAAGIFSAAFEAPQRFPNIIVLERIFNPTFLGRPLVFPWMKILVEFCLIFNSATAFMFHVVARAHRGDNEQNALLRNVSVD
jgi:hypothetical protein